MIETILSRQNPSPSSQNPEITSLQRTVDDLTSSFITQATNPQILTAMMVGGAAYRFGRMRMMGANWARQAAPLQRSLSIGFGLSSEVVAFEFTHRTLLTLSPHPPSGHPLPGGEGGGEGSRSLWSWSGPYGWKEGLLTSFVTFGTLKGFGRLSQGQNLILQHLVQDSGMVLGHHVIHQAGLSPRPEGSLAEQFLHAETTNLQMKGGLGLVHALSGGRILAMERGLDLMIRSQQGMEGPAFPSLSFAAAGASPSGGAQGRGLSSHEGTKIKTPLILMSTQEGEGKSRGKIIAPPKEGERGEFEIGGSVDLDQFYGRGGGSDADTVKLKMEPTQIRWKARPEDKWQKISPEFLEGANVIGKPVLDSQGRVTLRLQGVDAPELHYPASPVETLEEASPRAQARWENALFRQHGAYRATVALVGMLSTYATQSRPNKIKARAHAWVGSPADLFDVYGRFVSELLLGAEGESLNLWLLKKGWGIPAFYTSMSANEIQTLREAAVKAREKGLGLWPRYREQLVDFDPEVRLPKKEEPPLVPKGDEGTFHLPKLFRRQVHFEVNRRAGLLRLRSLHSFLEEREEYWLPTEEYLRGAPTSALRPLSELIDKSGAVLYNPEEMVFVERNSSLSDSKGEKILTFETETPKKSRKR